MCCKVWWTRCCSIPCKSPRHRLLHSGPFEEDLLGVRPLPIERIQERSSLRELGGCRDHRAAAGVETLPLEPLCVALTAGSHQRRRAYPNAGRLGDAVAVPIDGAPGQGRREIEEVRGYRQEIRS